MSCFSRSLWNRSGLLPSGQPCIPHLHFCKMPPAGYGISPSIPYSHGTASVVKDIPHSISLKKKKIVASSIFTKSRVAESPLHRSPTVGIFRSLCCVETRNVTVWHLGQAVICSFDSKELFRGQGCPFGLGLQIEPRGGDAPEARVHESASMGVWQ